MSNAYYSQQPQRQAAYDNPLHNAYQARSQAHPQMSSQTNLYAPTQDGVDYHHYHGAAPSHALHPYQDPYSTLTPGDERMRPSLSNENLMRQTSPYGAKDANNSYLDESHDDTLRGRGADFALAKDEESGRYGFGRGHRIEATDGLLPDTPPDMDRLNPEQKEIMKQFPPDLDDENGGKTGLQAAKDLLKGWKSWFKLRYLHWWVMLIVVVAIVVLTTLYHKQIVDWLTPISRKVTTVAWGWIIPVAILFIISFPPLFGHEIVLILVGLVYGIWIGFGIASLGTLLGEIGNFYAFKTCLRSTAAKYERKNIHYACMADMVRDGGFWVMFLARLSAIPGHFTTAVFATVGMNIFIFTFAAVLALPKQLLIVYLGVAIKNSGDGTEDTKSKVIKYVVLVISFIITVWTAYWLYQKMEKVRPSVSARLRQKRYELLLQARTPGTEGFRGGDRGHVYPPNGGYGMSQSQGALDASFGYRKPEQADESYYSGQHGDISDETFNQPSFTQAAPTSRQQPVLSALQTSSPATQRYAPVPASQTAPPTADPTERQYNAQPTPGGRQPISAPMQFHRPIRQNSAVPSPTSPFHDPPRAPFDPQPAPVKGRADDERAPLTGVNGEWASTSSIAHSEGPPPDYASYAAPSVQSHSNARGRADPSVQRYHLSD
ncbi:SNARE associated Golgi protein [Kalmanozyma brasiliensis GHG001]|uniref:Golgi apparatus membrane protein TVP38 n=1 Tax=Kalmanozyma brasiliensis (strain GHG001) TaxID=1365824 RepID=V5GVG5_KALBG|nr:SNARE associated Golgi protein [Kalmanozyma brasiliensis GHG001]EST09892.1 SNARE associated Golgi protein [Kalmanozyma brasiliensis GHG001]